MKDARSYDRLSGLVLVLGLMEGLRPLIGLMIGGHGGFLSLATYLSGPARWLTSIGFVALTAVLLVWIDTAKKRRFPEDRK